MGNTILVLVYLAIIVIEIAAAWIMFQKAGQPGWASIIPFYNVVVMLRMIGRSGWWTLLAFVPIADIVLLVWIASGLSKAFGKGTGFAVGLFFLNFIFVPILAFGDAQYLGPDGRGAGRIAPAI
ncbi:MAG TPA: DUF5684 domain-containing protein [Thermomicrobiaceae bacterium]|nr:DUF5684 domain-containing protein [Thermomicrobiaceae bacterium]